jgi:hypothetical protein
MATILMLIDTSKRPIVYRTDNPEYYGKLCIDFFPEDLPTIAGFNTIKEVKAKIIKLFGRKQFKIWFPQGIELEQ